MIGRPLNWTRVGLFSIFAIASICAAQIPGQDNMPPILQKAIRAAGALKYSGERIVELKDGPDRIRNREIIWRDGENSRYEYPTGSRSEGQIIVERGRKRLHYFPDKNEIHISPSRRDEIAQRLVGSMKMGSRGGGLKYSFDDGGSVAGLRTSRVSIHGPRGELVQALWIHERTGMILKRELFNPVGGREGYYEFTRVNLAPRFRPSDFEIRVPGAKTLTPADLAIRYMKEGGFDRVFLEENADIELEGARILGGKAILAMHYRAKKGVLSLMQVRGEFEPRLLGRMRRDGQNVFSWKKGDRTFVLIGSLTEPELRSLSQKTQER